MVLGIGYILLILAVLNTVMLAFAYRDFSWELLGMALLSLVGLPLSIHLITKKELLHWFVSEDKEGNRLHVYREERNRKEEPIGFFENCR